MTRPCAFTSSPRRSLRSSLQPPTRNSPRGSIRFCGPLRSPSSWCSSMRWWSPRSSSAATPCSEVSSGRGCHSSQYSRPLGLPVSGRTASATPASVEKQALHPEGTTAPGGDRDYRCHQVTPACLPTCDVRGRDPQCPLHVETRRSILPDECRLRVEHCRLTSGPTIISSRLPCASEGRSNAGRIRYEYFPIGLGLNLGRAITSHRPLLFLDLEVGEMRLGAAVGPYVIAQACFARAQTVLGQPPAKELV